MNSMTIRLTNYVLILISFSLIQIDLSLSSGVPVLIWRNEGQTSKSDHLNRKSTTAQIDSNVLRDDYLKQSQTIIAFLQKDLSIEQFSSEDKNGLKTLNHIITDQRLEPILLTDVLHPNEAFNDFLIQDINDLNINNGQKIIINLPKNRLIENDRLIGDLLDKISPNISTNALFLITGLQNTKRFRRGVGVKKSDKESIYLMNVNNCLFFYTRSVDVKYLSENVSIPIISVTTFNSSKDRTSLPFGDSKCWDTVNPAILDLNYKNSKTKIQIKLTINKTENGFWDISNGFAILTDQNKQTIEFELITSYISAGKEFSYSCSSIKILSKIGNKGQYGLTRIQLSFNGFQLQPFANKNKYKIFANSEDCAVWMTIPLWMGFLTTILLSTILLIGIYILSKVNTPDRFENPKAKPLIITNADE